MLAWVKQCHWPAESLREKLGCCRAHHMQLKQAVQIASRARVEHCCASHTQLQNAVHVNNGLVLGYTLNFSRMPHVSELHCPLD